MPSTYCHGCGREIVFADHETGQTFNCAGRAFTVLAESPSWPARIVAAVGPAFLVRS